MLLRDPLSEVVAEGALLLASKLGAQDLANAARATATPGFMREALTSAAGAAGAAQAISHQANLYCKYRLLQYTVTTTTKTTTTSSTTTTTNNNNDDNNNDNNDDDDNDNDNDNNINNDAKH